MAQYISSDEGEKPTTKNTQQGYHSDLMKRLSITDKQKLKREFSTTKLALQEMLKEYL